MALQFLVDGLAMLAIMSSVSGVAAACTREGLFAASQSYILAQASGSISALNLSTSFSYQENNKPIDIKRGMLLQPLKIDLNRSTADTAACASYTLLISSSGPKPYVLATQIRHNSNDTGSIAMIDTIAATTGSLFFDAKKDPWLPPEGELVAPEHHPTGWCHEGASQEVW